MLLKLLNEIFMNAIILHHFSYQQYLFVNIQYALNGLYLFEDK